MIDFWLPAGLLLLVALAFLLIPALRVRKYQAEEDRTALNVTLYQERIAELQQQHANGALDAEQLEAGRAEAARELLSDTDSAPARTNVLGAKVPVIVAVLVPILALGLYMHWGAYDEVEQTRELASQMPQNIEEMTANLERAVKDNPKAAEAWYFLGRTYMVQGRTAEAANAFAQAIELVGREPELLGQLAQARYFAADKVWSDELQALTDEALQANPEEVTSLGLLGIAGYEAGRYQDAITYWQRLADVLPAEDPSREAILGGIERAREQQALDGQTQAMELKVKVSLADEVKSQVQPTDTVFIFARALNGPPMPLAVKRLTVAELPVTVTLSDNDAMMPELKLSGFGRVQLVARVSRSANATAGEWIGQSAAVVTTDPSEQVLVIDAEDVNAP